MLCADGFSDYFLPLAKYLARYLTRGRKDCTNNTSNLCGVFNPKGSGSALCTGSTQQYRQEAPVCGQ